MTIQYSFPALYKFLIKLTHRNELIKTIRAEVGKNNSVFDVAAGFGLAANYIDSSNEYYGIDLNKKFVNYGRKRGLKIELKDILDKSSYKYSDIFLLIDVIHHTQIENLKLLFDFVFEYARKKVIIVEPNFQSRKNAGFFEKIVRNILLKLDNDGINTISRWFAKKEYEKLFAKRFGSDFGRMFSLKTQEISSYYIVVFTKK